MRWKVVRWLEEVFIGSSMEEGRQVDYPHPVLTRSAQQNNDERILLNRGEEDEIVRSLLQDATAAYHVAPV